MRFVRIHDVNFASFSLKICNAQAKEESERSKHSIWLSSEPKPFLSDQQKQTQAILTGVLIEYFLIVDVDDQSLIQ